AVLRIEKSGLNAANWGDNDNLRVGNLALAIGRADSRLEAAPGAVVSLVSSEERRERRGGRRGKRGGRRGGKGRSRRMRILSDGFIQTNVVMYPGFSGGALVSGGGEIHGINTSGFSRQGGVTIPVTTIKNTVETLLAHGKMKQGYLGVGIQPVRLPNAVSEDREQETALLVNSIESNSPAADAGILVGDILVAMDDESLEQMDDLMSLLRGERIGKESTLTLIRGGEMMNAKVTVGERE
ncbi:MAG: S1C family serine protease, partial [Aggregatilineales bacterium]